MSVKETGIDTKQASAGARAHMHTCACVGSGAQSQSSWLSFPSWGVWRNPEPLDDGSVPID